MTVFEDKQIAKYPPPGTRVTAAEWDALPETMSFVELIDGFIYYPHGYKVVERGINLPSPELSHQKTLGDTFIYLNQIIPDGTILFAPVQVTLFAGDETYLEPDILWIAENTTRSRISTRGVEGAPELVIEALSPGNNRHDTVIKFALYERAGVPEYWLLRIEDQSLEVFVLRDGQYIRLGIYAKGDTFESPIIGRTVDAARIFP